MKRSLFLNLLLAATLVLGGTIGCKRKPKSPTPIPAARTGIGSGGNFPEVTPPPGGVVVVPPVTPGPEFAPGGDPNREGDLEPITEDMRGWTVDRDTFAAYTVYFDFDRSTIRSGERAKVEAVGRHILANPGQGVRIEGHCDERGTEGYNLALGERRALAVREYLLNLGVPTNRVDTISYGESKPAAIGNTEEAYSKNRRGEFLLLSP